MSAKDVHHDAVRHALKKDGWTITHDPYRVEIGSTEMYIDLGAEKLLAAEKNGQKIAVEIKSFTHASTLYEYHQALGQFMNYRLALELEEPERTLHLAVPLHIYQSFFTQRFPQQSVQRYAIPLLIYSTRNDGVIEQWQ